MVNCPNPHHGKKHLPRVIIARARSFGKAYEYAMGNCHRGLEGRINHKNSNCNFCYFWNYYRTIGSKS